MTLVTATVEAYPTPEPPSDAGRLFVQTDRSGEAQVYFQLGMCT